MSTANTTPSVEKKGAGAAALAVYGLVIVLIMASAVTINIVLDGNAGMWAMTLFGAIIICAIISGAALHSMREDQH